MPNLFSNNHKDRVAGLRDYEEPGEVRIFKLMEDGNIGELVRVENAVKFAPSFNNGRKRQEEVNVYE
jgi:hypothetical protein